MYSTAIFLTNTHLGPEISAFVPVFTYIPSFIQSLVSVASSVFIYT